MSRDPDEYRYVFCTVQLSSQISAAVAVWASRWFARRRYEHRTSCLHIQSPEGLFCNTVTQTRWPTTRLQCPEEQPLGHQLPGDNTKPHGPTPLHARIVDVLGPHGNSTCLLYCVGSHPATLGSLLGHPRSWRRDPRVSQP